VPNTEKENGEKEQQKRVSFSDTVEVRSVCVDGALRPCKSRAPAGLRPERPGQELMYSSP